MFYTLVSIASAAPNCASFNFPDEKVCVATNWNLPGKDPCRPLKIPVDKQQVYIKDAVNFCINLPNQETAPRSNGVNPSILDGEGYVQAYCMGQLSPGALQLPKGGVISAHVSLNQLDGKKYYQIYGKLDCDVLNINCQGPPEDPYGDGGQYDTVEWKRCGKEPYSGVYEKMNPGMTDYNQQCILIFNLAGAGIYCMRVCEAGLEKGDPCNPKMDTAGCYDTMGITSSEMEAPGFDYVNNITGETKTFKIESHQTLKTKLSTASYKSKIYATKTASVNLDADTNAAGKKYASLFFFFLF